LNSQSTPAAATQEPNIQNVNPNVIHSSGSSSTAASNASSSSHITSPTSSSTTSINKSQVITPNIHAKSSSNNVNVKDDRPKGGESLVVSVPLSSTTTVPVPGIQMPTNSVHNSSNSTTVSTIVTNQAQIQNTSPTTMSVSSSSLPASHGSLYQHLTNSQAGNQRASPLVGRASPIVPLGNSSLAHDSHNNSSNHTSVLQNINSGGVISTGFHGSTSLNETSPTMLKVQYEKQSSSRVHVLQQEEAQSGRRSRYVLHLKHIFCCCCCHLSFTFIYIFVAHWIIHVFGFLL
jgi:hypothetical protein